ncbi:hypothetical protein AMATHDRAFT_71230 [Amanita thiersii Skay4041]|uniref:DUF6533 domain-containing protein n=1 Tax=Amanita thiersii Skay4041 TaxID=703135 RepID=A0A2A9ND98_9AGAR|nr:hypothetical protein AMATHDRAFT_71230 [Amanita thiersii Skay4041]
MSDPAVQQLRDFVFNNSLQACGLTILLYDHCLILEQEIRYIWRPRFSLVTALYIIAKYLGFVNVCLTSISLLAPSMIDSLHCRVFQAMNIYIEVIGMAAAGAILALKAWAVWERNKAVGIGLLLTYTFLLGSALIATTLWFIIAPSTPLTRTRISCPQDIKSIYAVSYWLMCLLLETIVTCLLLVKGARSYKYRNMMQFFDVIYTDGLLYYLYMSSLGITAVILTKVVYPKFLVSLGLPLRTIGFSLVTRSVLRTRERALQPPCII